jgi:outer membrane protein with beta-barrel domain
MASMPIRVRRLMVLCGALLCLWLIAPMPSFAGPCTEQSEAPGIFVPVRGCFGLGVGYQYQHYDVLGVKFHNHAYSADLSMHLFDLVTGAAGRLTVGAEGMLTAGFGGNTGGNPSLNAKSFFLGAGPHIALENASRFEPWVHGLAGWQHFRFTQAGTLGSNSALGYMVGGGLDIRLTPGIYWRFQADYLGTHFQSSLQSNYSAGTGVILYF